MFIVSSAAAVEHPESPKDFQDCKHMFWDWALSGGILWAFFPPLFIAAANKDLFEWNCRLCVYNLSHFWLLKASLEKTLLLEWHDWETILLPVLLFISPLAAGQGSHFRYSFCNNGEKEQQGFHLAQMLCGTEWCHCLGRAAGIAGAPAAGTAVLQLGPCAGSTKGGQGYLQLLTIDCLYKSHNRLLERSAAENQADPSSSKRTNSPSSLARFL